MITTLHIVLVASFIAVTSVLLGMTIIQRSRIRGVKMTWVSRRTGSFLIWPSVFMGLVLVFTLYSRNTLAAVDDSVFAGYVLGGILWFVATLLSSSVVVTEYGIVPETGRGAEAVGWGCRMASPLFPRGFCRIGEAFLTIVGNQSRTWPRQDGCNSS